MEKVVMSSLPYVPDIQLVRSTLEQCKANVNEAVSRLLDHDVDEEISSIPVEGDADDQPLLVDTKPGPEIPSTGKHDGNMETNISEGEQRRSVNHKSRDKKHNHVEKDKQKDSNTITKTKKGMKEKSEHAKDLKDLGKPADKQKRETARDKKERQKREAMAKKRDKNSKTISSDVEKKPNTGLDSQVEQGMRVLHL